MGIRWQVVRGTRQKYKLPLDRHPKPKDLIYIVFSKRGELPQAHFSTLGGKWLSPVRTYHIADGACFYTF